MNTPMNMPTCRAHSCASLCSAAATQAEARTDGTVQEDARWLLVKRDACNGRSSVRRPPTRRSDWMSFYPESGPFGYWLSLLPNCDRDADGQTGCWQTDSCGAKIHSLWRTSARSDELCEFYGEQVEDDLSVCQVNVPVPTWANWIAELLSRVWYQHDTIKYWLTRLVAEEKVPAQRAV